MNFIGKPKVARVPVDQLYPVKERFGIVSLRRDTKGVNEKRKWWMGKAVDVFGTYEGFVKQTVGLKGEVWTNVRGCIQRHSKGRGR